MDKKEKTPEDNLMEAIFGKKYKTEAEIESEIQKVVKNTTSENKNLNNDSMMLFIHAMNRREELMPMVEKLLEGKYFPSSNYRKVFQWSLMQAAQWQYEKLMENAIERKITLDAGGYPKLDCDGIEFYDYSKDQPLAKEGQKVKVITILEELEE